MSIACPAPILGQHMAPAQTTKGPESMDLPRSLEALINDCFQSTMDSHALSAPRLEYAQKFQKYLAECHSQENLAFLIEIFRYEYFYERLSPIAQRPAAPKALSSSLVDRSLEQFIDRLPYPTPSMGRHLRRASVKSQSNVSIASSTGVPFALDFDEPAPDHSDPWTNFSHQQLSQDSDSDLESETGGSVLHIDDSPTSSSADTETATLLTDQWSFIIGMYVEERAEAQINLSNKTYRAIMDCHRNETPPHSPHVLLAAKTEVMQLIHENTYHPFTKMMSHNCCAGSGCGYSCACTSSGCSPTCSQNSPVPRKLQTPSSSSSSSSGSRTNSANSTPGTSTKQVSSNIPVAPVPHKKRSKFLSSLSSHGASSSDVTSSSPLNSIFTHFKHQGSNAAGVARAYSSAPQSPAHPSTPSREVSPLSHMHTHSEDVIQRPRSSAVPETHSSPSILGKLWKKRR